MDSVRNATFRIGFPPPYVSLRSIRCKSLDRHMAAFSILKWQNSLQEGKSSLQNATRGFPYIRKWQNSLQEGKSLSRYNAASFYPEMAKLTSEGKSLDRHMAASSILKWHSSLQEGKSFSRYNATSFYPEMAKFDKSRQI